MLSSVYEEKLEVRKESRFDMFMIFKKLKINADKCYVVAQMINHNLNQCSMISVMLLMMRYEWE